MKDCLAATKHGQETPQQYAVMAIQKMKKGEPHSPAEHYSNKAPAKIVVKLVKYMNSTFSALLEHF